MELSTTTITKGRRYVYDGWMAVAERKFEAADSGTTTLEDGASKLERIYVTGPNIDEWLYAAIDFNSDGDIADDLNSTECSWSGGVAGKDTADAAFYFLTNRMGSTAALLDKNSDRKILEYYRYRAFGEMITLPVVDDGLAEGSTAADGIEDSPLSLTDNNTLMLTLRTTHGEFAGRVSWWGNEYRRSYARFSGPTGIEFQDGKEEKDGKGSTGNGTTGDTKEDKDEKKREEKPAKCDAKDDYPKKVEIKVVREGRSLPRTTEDIVKDLEGMCPDIKYWKVKFYDCYGSGKEDVERQVLVANSISLQCCLKICLDYVDKPTSEAAGVCDKDKRYGGVGKADGAHSTNMVQLAAKGEKDYGGEAEKPGSRAELRCSATGNCPTGQVLLHEVLHNIGLDHVDNKDNVMHKTSNDQTELNAQQCTTIRAKAGGKEVCNAK